MLLMSFSKCLVTFVVETIESLNETSKVAIRCLHIFPHKIDYCPVQGSSDIFVFENEHVLSAKFEIARAETVWSYTKVAWRHLFVYIQVFLFSVQLILAVTYYYERYFIQQIFILLLERRKYLLRSHDVQIPLNIHF